MKPHLLFKISAIQTVLPCACKKKKTLNYLCNACISTQEYGDRSVGNLPKSIFSYFILHISTSETARYLRQIASDVMSNALYNDRSQSSRQRILEKEETQMSSLRRPPTQHTSSTNKDVAFPIAQQLHILSSICSYQMLHIRFLVLFSFCLSSCSFCP